MAHTKLTSAQIAGFWGAWSGWTLDGMDSFIYALVLSPALSELLPRSGYAKTPANVGLAGSILFALFLVGWGLSFMWGPVADRFGRTRVLAATILTYAVFTGAAALAVNVWQLGLFRLLAGIGIGGEWALAGTYVAEAWPEDRRKMGAGFLQTGYYFGFFLAAALNYTVGARFGWRAMFLCGLSPVIISVLILARVKEPERWKERAALPRQAGQPKHASLPQLAGQAGQPRLTGQPGRWGSSLAEIFGAKYRRKTVVNAALLTVAIIGLWAGAVYEPTAIITLAKKAGMSVAQASKAASIGTAILSMGTILGCLMAPILAERLGRKSALAIYFLGMSVFIWLSFGWAFYLENGLTTFVGCLFFLGFFGGNFTLFSLWLPEQYETSVRATAFAFATSFGRFIGAGVNFMIGAMVRNAGTIGKPVAYTAIAFGLGLLIIPFAQETRGQSLPI
jgi:MFS family permease